MYDCNTFYIHYIKYKSHRTLYKVFTLPTYNYDTFYVFYSNYDTFYAPYKMYKNYVKAAELCKKSTPHIYNHDTFYISCKEYKSQVIVPS